MMHELTGNIVIAELIPAARYANAGAANAASVEKDIKDGQRVIMYVSAGVVGGVADLTVTLQGATTTGGALADLDDDAGADAELVLTAAGNDQVEVPAQGGRRFIKALVNQCDANDEFGVYAIIGHYETMAAS
ncbi:MAG: hypothetical protein WC340_17010 [Kiritimatiellia bacterium]